MLRRWALLSFIAAASAPACSGELFITESDTSGKCTTDDQCPGVQTCDLGSGTCVDVWCQCAPGQGCDQGTCVDLVSSGNGANSCSPQRTDGLCADNRACCEGGAVCCAASEVCVGDHCVPDDRPCSSTEPNGWCGPDLSCVRGRCVPLDRCACAANNTSGCCPDGEACQSGVCAVQTCSATVPGACNDDFVCDTTGCTQLPCGPGHLQGFCASGVCSVTGACISSGTCAALGDCAIGKYCAADKTCQVAGTCFVDEDCETQLGQGYACDTGTCVERTTCVSSLDCVPTEYCSGDGNCLALPKCDVSADCGDGKFCGGDHQCVTNGCCDVNADCDGGHVCVERGACDICIASGTCTQQSDCPPAFTCDTGSGTCNPSGTACDSNAFSANGCAPGDLSCCVSGGSCCPFGQLCSDVDRCIPFGECVDSGDCVAGFDCVKYTCVPNGNAACPCAAGQHCVTVRDSGGQAATGCVADTQCASLVDCSSGYRCNAGYQCELDPQCGVEQLTTGAFVPPNVLIVFDRSGSMQLCDAGDPEIGECGYNYGSCDSTACPGTPAGLTCEMWPSGKLCVDPSCNFGCNDPPTCSTHLTDTRWSQALSAIDGVIDNYTGEVDFGLSIFPHPPGGEHCDTNCNWLSCSDRSNLNHGVVDVPVGSTTGTTIKSTLAASAPGGATPTAATLRYVLGLANLGGLNSVDRPNAVLLVTDGTPADSNVGITTCNPPCSDGIKNAGETGVDCGGLCPACTQVGGEVCANNSVCQSGSCLPSGACAAPSCVSADDCATHLCRGGACRPATCDDGSQNAGETATDCGGLCPGCADGIACVVAGDCNSGVCGSNNLCSAATCADGIKNGTETGVDCGGGCTTHCADGMACQADTDCQSPSFCDTTNVCRPAHCIDSMNDNGETGVDCGGACQICLGAGCRDGIKNGSETDIDCGGSTCPKCAGAKNCAVAGDCLSGACTNCDNYSAACVSACTSTGASTAACQQECQLGCEVDTAIDQLYSEPERIKTFVIGFNITGSAELNCNAVHGKTANRNVAGCEDLTAATCGDPSAPTCYYDAGDAAALQTALNDVIQQVSSCSFQLQAYPPNGYGVDVYLEDAGNPGSRALATQFEEYVYDINFNQVQFLSTTCNQVKSGAKIPIIIFGCAQAGG